MLWLKQHWQVPLFIVFAITVILFPSIDLYVTGLVWNEEQGFILRDNGFVRFMYEGFHQIPKLIIPLLIIAIVLAYTRDNAKKYRKTSMFLFLVLLTGPGLVVHGLKDHWDRGRPRHVEEFGGKKEFSPAFVISDQCERNCSFPSGHAAMGFYFMALGWVFRRRWVFALGLTVGVFASFGRIVQGGHFFSDVITSGFIVFFTCQLLAWKIFGTERINGKIKQSPE